MMAAAHGISKQQKSRQVMMRAGHQHEPWPRQFCGADAHWNIGAAADTRGAQDVLFLPTSQAWGKT